MKKIIFGFICILGAIIIFCYFLNKDCSLSKLQKAKTIKIGYAIEAPYAFVKTNGEVTGLSTTVAKEIANRLGIPNVEWKLMEFGSLINELELKKIDVIASGMFITKERAEKINFSEPTFFVKQGLIVTKGNPKKLISYEESLHSNGLKIAVIKGSIEESLLKEIGFAESRLIIVPDAESAKIAVITGLADALAISLPTANWMILHGKMDNLEIAFPFHQPHNTIITQKGYGAVEFNKKDKQLQKAWNNELKKFIGSPKHLGILKKFGFTTDDLPGSISTQKILHN